MARSVSTSSIVRHLRCSQGTPLFVRRFSGHLDHNGGSVLNGSVSTPQTNGINTIRTALHRENGSHALPTSMRLNGRAALITEDLNGVSTPSQSSAQHVATTTIPSSRGPLKVAAFKTSIGDVIAIVNGIGNGRRVPVRVHDACLTGEALGSLKCDCGMQLNMALDAHTKDRHGVIIYMPQEGRGIGLANKIAAYSLQEEIGLDTVDANLALGLPAEMRNYSVVRGILKAIGVESILLMTNNPFKVQQLQTAGVNVEGTLSSWAQPKAEVTRQYLETKRVRMGHTLPHRPLRGLSHSQESLESQAAEFLAQLRLQMSQRLSQQDRPFTLLSFASSMDGFIASLRPESDGSESRLPVALSGQASLTLTHHLRGSMDAILVGVGTVLSDNPRLDVRVTGAGPSPRPVVLDSKLRLPLDSRLLTHRVDGGRAPTLLLFQDDGSEELLRRRSALEAAGAVTLSCMAASADGQICLQHAWQSLFQLGLRSVMVEGGSKVIRSFLTRSGPENLVDRVVVTQAPKLLGRGVPWAASGLSLTEVSSFVLGQDAIFSGRLSA